ncbi:MAG: hypothetical protein ABI333_12460 [bacterium]
MTLKTRAAGWILDEPELLLEEQILVPDLAGWRQERISRTCPVIRSSR